MNAGFWWRTARVLGAVSACAMLVASGILTGPVTQHRSVALAAEVVQLSKAGDRIVLMEGFGPVTLKCGQEYRHTEPTEGTLGFRFQCLTQKGVVNWDFTLSPMQRSQSPLGNIVNESGMKWTRNGVPQPMNSPHSAEPNDYWFHGTLNPTASGDEIMYDDTLTYPNNFGGQTTLKILGTIHLEEF